MPFDAFLKLTGIPGESTVPQHANEIQVIEFSSGLGSQGVQAEGIPSGGRPQFDDFRVLKKIDRATPLLFEACASQTMIQQAVLYLRKNPQSPQKFDFVRYTMNNVLVTSLRDFGNIFQNPDPLEEITLSYTQIFVEYRFQLPNGQLSPFITRGWDVPGNTPV